VQAVAGSDDPDAFRVLLVGDSLAVSLFLGLERWVADREGVRVMATSRQCAFAVGAERKHARRRVMPSPDCVSRLSGLATRVGELEPDVVIAMAGYWEMRPRPGGISASRASLPSTAGCSTA
jgi:hypothetical protein